MRGVVGAAVVGGLTACAQFRPPVADEGGGGGAASGACAVRGYPYTYADKSGTSVSSSGESLSPLRVEATLAKAGEVYAGVGLVFNEPKAPLDASDAEGVSFTAKRSASSTAFVRFKVPDASTDPDGGVCSECFNDFGLPFQVTEQWTRYEVRFADLKQEADWGAPRPAAVDRAKLYGLQWQVAVPGAELDLAIDEITFLGCGDS